MTSDTHFENIEEYREYVNGLSPSDLYDILSNIDREQYPDRYEIVASLAEEKKVFGPGNLVIPKGVHLVRNIYIVLLLLGVLSLPLQFLADEGQMAISGVLILMLSIVLSGSIIAGIHLIKPWVVTLVLWFSYLSLARLFVDAIADSISPPPGHPVSTILFAVFFSYQIAVFSKSTTKRFFKHRGVDII